MDSSSVNKRLIAHEFLSSHRVATLATVDKDKKPDAASLYYLVDEELTLYFMTRIESRKFQNLQNEPSVTMVISDENTMETVQIRGKAERIENYRQEGDVLSNLWGVEHTDPRWPGPSVKMYEAGHSLQLVAVKVVPQNMTYAKFDRKDTGKYNTFFQKII